ncbi:unnamed protein product [Nezara viridula]|uniref:Uncharacterized protein n=1 Tax=Nezara viridula TaxID=85310 RepID=A0A9P0HNW1_NEZVI|nr:unnamed protein product [Nezara viridula]
MMDKMKFYAMLGLTKRRTFNLNENKIAVLRSLRCANPNPGREYYKRQHRPLIGGPLYCLRHKHSNVFEIVILPGVRVQTREGPPILGSISYTADLREATCGGALAKISSGFQQPTKLAH